MALMMLTNLAAGFCAVTTTIHFVTAAVAAFRCRRHAAHSVSTDTVPAVSVLRPICGAENFLAEAVASSFRLNHPDYEVIFCAARSDDPAVPVVRRIIETNPELPARLLIGDDGIASNPKLGNLVKGWDAARHEWIVIVDSNVVMTPDVMLHLFAAWRPDTGVVCSMPIGSRPQSFAAELECAFLNTLQARFQYVSEALGWGFAQGKTMLLRRDIVDAAGGIRALAAETAEDAATTKLVRGVGLSVHLVDRPVEQPLGRRRLSEVWARQLRWARLRRVSFPLLFLPELFVGSALPATALVLATSEYDSTVSTVAVLSLCVVWLMVEAVLARAVGWHFTGRTVAALLMRDLLLPALWVAAWLGNDYVWRGTRVTAQPRQDWQVGSAIDASQAIPGKSRFAEARRL
jgi:ceramide glucosyltransferase